MATPKMKLAPLALISLVGAVLRFYGLGSQPLSGDDIGVFFSAWNFVDAGNLGPTMWNHPPLRNLAVYASLWLFGEGAWGLKMPSLVLGALSVPALYWLTFRLFLKTEVAALAALFLALDPLHVDFSRQAVHEVYMMFFSIAGILCAVKFHEMQRPVWLMCSGVLFGLGLASKWYVVFPLVTTFVFLGIAVMKDGTGKKIGKGDAVAFMSSALIILPVTLYLLTFIPWFQRGFNLGEWLSLQRFMYKETISHSGYNPFGLEIDHSAWLWFLKPVAFADFIVSKEGPIVLLAIANPFTWLLTLPAMLYLAYKTVKEKSPEYSFVVCTFWFTYLPFLMTKRPIWAHTAFSVLPFGFMAISSMMIDWTDSTRKRIMLLSGYVFLVVLLSVPLYVLAVGKGFTIEWLKPIVMMYRPSYDR